MNEDDFGGQCDSKMANWMEVVAPCGNYTYTLIKDLKVGSVYNVYGVVKSCREPVITRGGWNMLSLWIADESCAKKDQPSYLPCLLFGSDKINLPEVEVGNIVRFHRLRISMYQNLAQGKTAPGFSWLVVSGNDVRHSHDNITYTPDDEKRIKELRTWKETSPPYLLPTSKISRISDITIKDDWINMVVQVVSVFQSSSDSTCALIVCWDGTKPSFLSHTYCSMDKKIFDADCQLESASLGKVVKIHCYDNHAEDALNFASGQILKLANVHAKPVDNAAVRNAVLAGIIKDQVGEDSHWLALVMHKGSFNGRKVRTLNESDIEYQDLQKLLPDKAESTQREARDKCKVKGKVIGQRVETETMGAESPGQSKDAPNEGKKQDVEVDENQSEPATKNIQSNRNRKRKRKHGDLERGQSEDQPMSVSRANLNDDITGIRRANDFFAINAHINSELLENMGFKK